jgi:hypothetical protein
MRSFAVAMGLPLGLLVFGAPISHVLIYSGADDGSEWRVEEPERPLDWLSDENSQRLLDAEPPETKEALLAQRTPRYNDPTDAD